MAQEIERWITVNGVHIPIMHGQSQEEAVKEHFAKQANSDIDKREKQIAQNRKEAQSRNKSDKQLSQYGKESYYSKFKNIDDAAAEFTKRTGIKIYADDNGHISEIYNKESIVRVLDKLEELQNKFNINDPNDRDQQVILELLPPEYLTNFAGRPEFRDNEMAHARGGIVSLNPKYFGLSPEELDEGYAACGNFHPLGTSGADIISHEVGHALFHNHIRKLCSSQGTNWVDVERGLVTGRTQEEKSQKTVKFLHQEFYGCIKEFSAGKNSSYGDYHILALANPEITGNYGISGYAGENHHELMAEAFCDYSANGKNAKELSKILVSKILNRK